MLKDLPVLISKKWTMLIGRPRLTIKNKKCGNIVCGKRDRFKKYEEGIYLCECGFIMGGDGIEIEETHKIKLYCKVGAANCPDSKTKMDTSCIRCPHIGEK